MKDKGLRVVKICLSLCVLCSVAPIQPSAQALSKEDEILREFMWDKLSRTGPAGRPSVGLALSGGGARGFAHAGVLEALGYAGFPLDSVSGTSMGSVIGALYASGMSVPVIWGFAEKARTLKISRDFSGIKFLSLLIADKLITPTYINQFIEENLGSLSFERLATPFACVALDFRTGERVILDEGPLAAAVRASVNLPGVFAPFEYRHRYLVDGGMVDFVPVDAARHLGADWVLASVTAGVSDEVPDSVLLSLLKVIEIQGNLLAGIGAKTADFVIRPEVGSMKMTDFDSCEAAGEAGLIEASRRVDQAREAYLVFSARRLLEGL